LKQKQIIVIGGGAAGFFAAINAAELNLGCKVIIIEKTNKLLSKVQISGGGRCNVTHNCLDITELVKNYPRGDKELRQAFARFSVQDTINWFEKRGVKLKVEPDGRMFPVTDNSETIIDCFMQDVKRLGIDIHMQEEVISLKNQKNTHMEVNTGKRQYLVNCVIVSSGGHNQARHYGFIQAAGHTIVEPVPSLFTLNIPNNNIKELMGLSVKKATVKVAGTRHQYSGPVLITHWGLSGPAVLKLSAFAAIDFFKMNYKAAIQVNWTGTLNEEKVKEILEQNASAKSYVLTAPLFDVPKRLWEYFVLKAEVPMQKPWNELSKKQMNRLAQVLCNDTYMMEGKTTFKEEFVTSGGVDLKEVDFRTMQSKLFPNLYFCGEVLNIDGITGGFNFQSAWTTAWIAAENASRPSL